MLDKKTLVEILRTYDFSRTPIGQDDPIRPRGFGGMVDAIESRAKRMVGLGKYYRTQDDLAQCLIDDIYLAYGFLSSCYASINFDKLTRNREEQAVIFLSNVYQILLTLGKEINTFTTECHRTRSKQEAITENTKGYQEMLVMIKGIRALDAGNFYRNRIKQLENELETPEKPVGGSSTLKNLILFITALASTSFHYPTSEDLTRKLEVSSNIKHKIKKEFIFLEEEQKPMGKLVIALGEDLGNFRVAHYHTPADVYFSEWSKIGRWGDVDPSLAGKTRLKSREACKVYGRLGGGFYEAVKCEGYGVILNEEDGKLKLCYHRDITPYKDTKRCRDNPNNSKGKDARGSELTTHQTLAVDPKIIPLSSTVWLEFLDKNGKPCATPICQRHSHAYKARDVGAFSGKKADLFTGYGADNSMYGRIDSAAGLPQKARVYLLRPIKAPNNERLVIANK